MKKEMLINVAQSEECRIAIVENGVLEELYVERASQESYVGNIYKGKIVNIEPSIQAAFVDFGIGRNGFLHVSDVDPVYYKHLLPKHVIEEIEAEQDEKYGVSNRRRERSDDRGERRDRRERGPKPMTTWLPPEQPSGDGDFGTGLVEETFGGEIVSEASQVESFGDFGHEVQTSEIERPASVHEKSEVETFGDFGQGVETFEAKPSAKPTVARETPEASTTWAPPPKASSPVIVDDFGDFGDFGAGLDDAPSEATTLETEIIDVEVEVVGEEKPKKRTRKPAGEKKERKPRKKKEDTEPPAPYQESAEHRTEPPEEEPEIRPFFEGSFADSFDVNAPNDRFSAEVEAVNDDAFGGFTDEAEDVSEEPPPLPTSEDETPLEDEFAPPPSREERGERPRRDRGDRGERRGRREDRGDRGDRGDRRGPPRDRKSSNGPPPRDRGFPRLPIEQIFKRGQEVIVQVIKEGIGTKGPTLSTYVSIAGRYLVLMPSLARVGVSRKIEDMDARRRLREIMNDLNPPKGVGFIVRTAAIDRNPEELQSDLAYLLRLWQVLVRRLRKVSAPVEIYRESDMITRTIRDNFKSDIDSITVDDPNAFQHAAEFMQVVMPRYADRIKNHEGPEPLFHRYRIEEEIAKLNHKRLELPRGGSIIIEQTEALVAIDVNSGTYRSEKDAEETAYQVNLMAAKEIARQLRLRDLGGVIVNDFIDMREDRHRRHVEKTLHDALERDKARTKVLRISQFGIIEMTRQRMQQSLKKRIYNECGHCKGTGLVKTNETLGIDAMRMLSLAAAKAINGQVGISSVHVGVCEEAAKYLLNRKRREIAALEENARMEVTIVGVPNVSPDHLDIKCHDTNGNDVKLLSSGPPPKFGKKHRD